MCFDTLTSIYKDIMIRSNNGTAKKRSKSYDDFITGRKRSSAKISDDIIALILEENLKPGDKLPNETILSQRLDVGRSSLREAMKLLASRNIVTIRQGSGTYIAASPGMVEDPLGFYFH